MVSLGHLVLTPVSGQRPQQTHVGLTTVMEENNTEQSDWTEGEQGTPAGARRLPGVPKQGGVGSGVSPASGGRELLGCERGAAQVGWSTEYGKQRRPCLWQVSLLFTPEFSLAVLGACGTPLRNRAGPTCTNLKVTPTEKGDKIWRSAHL